MAHYVGLDVSVRHTSICIVDDVGKVVREASPKTDDTTQFSRSGRRPPA